MVVKNSSMKKITLVSVLLFSIVTFSTKAQSSVEGKNILIVYGGWQGHQPEVFAKKIASWLEEQNANVTL